MMTTSSECICISGHTHYSHDFIDNGVRYISNQKGYNSEPDIHTNYSTIGVYNLDK